MSEKNLDKLTVLSDIKNLSEEHKLERISSKKIQVFGNSFINIYFLRSGFEITKGNRGYYVIIENETHPIQPMLLTVEEINEKLGILIDDYY